MRLELPFPDRRLSPNARVHHMTKARVVREYREDCAWAAMALRQNGKQPSVAPPVSAVVTFVVPDRRKRDLDNLLAMLKPAWDGLCDAGVLAGDDSERFSVESTEVVVVDNYADVNRCSWCVAKNHRRCHGVCNCPHNEPKVIVELRSL